MCIQNLVNNKICVQLRRIVQYEQKNGSVMRKKAYLHWR